MCIYVNTKLKNGLMFFVLLMDDNNVYKQKQKNKTETTCVAYIFW